MLLLFLNVEESTVTLRRAEEPWLVWLKGLSASLQNKGSPVQFPVGAQAWVAGQVPSEGCTRGNHTLIFLSLSLSLPLSLSLKKKKRPEEWVDTVQVQTVSIGYTFKIFMGKDRRKIIWLGSTVKRLLYLSWKDLENACRRGGGESELENNEKSTYSLRSNF